MELAVHANLRGGPKNGVHFSLLRCAQDCAVHPLRSRHNQTLRVTLVQAGTPLVVQRLSPLTGLSLEQRDHNAQLALDAAPATAKRLHDVAIPVGLFAGLGLTWWLIKSSRSP